MRRGPSNAGDAVLSQILSCLDAAANRPGLVQASVSQTEGYLRGFQGLAWELPPSPAPANASESFLEDMRSGAVALRGRLKKNSEACLEAFARGFFQTFPGAENKPFANAMIRTWVRWLAGCTESPAQNDPAGFSWETGRKTGERLKEEYEEGLAGSLAGFLLDKRLHLIRVRQYLHMRGWLLGTIEHLRRSQDASDRERAGILAANLSSIVLRAQHHAGPGYGALAVDKLASMTRGLDQAASRLKTTEPEAAAYLSNNRSTILARALHSGFLDYGEEVSERLPSALRSLDKRIERLESSSPETAKILRAKKRTVVYRALTNGRLDILKSK